MNVNPIPPSNGVPVISPSSSNRCGFFTNIFNSISSSASQVYQKTTHAISAKKETFGTPDPIKVESYRKILQQHGGTPQLEKSIHLIADGLGKAYGNKIPLAVEALLTAALANIAQVASKNGPNLLTDILEHVVSIVDKHMLGKATLIKQIEALPHSERLLKLLEPVHKELFELAFPNGKTPDLGFNSLMNGVIKWLMSFLKDPKNMVIIYNCIIDSLSNAENRRSELKKTRGGEVILQITDLVSQKVPGLLLDYLSYRCSENTLFTEPIGPITQKESLTHSNVKESKKSLMAQIGFLANHIPKPLLKLSETLLDSAVTKLFLHLAEHKLVEKQVSGRIEYELIKTPLQNSDPFERVLENLKTPLKKFYSDCGATLKAKLYEYRKWCGELQELEAQGPNGDITKEALRQARIKELNDFINVWYASKERIELSETAFIPFTENLLKTTGMDKTEGLKLDFNPFLKALIESFNGSYLVTVASVFCGNLDPNVDKANLNKKIFKDLTPYGLFCLVEWAISNYPSLLDWIDPETSVKEKATEIDRVTSSKGYSAIAKTAASNLAQYLVPPLLNHNDKEWSTQIVSKIHSLLPLNINFANASYQQNQNSLESLIKSGLQNIAGRQKDDKLMEFAATHVEEVLLTIFLKNSSGQNANPILNIMQECTDIFVAFHTLQGPKIATEYARLPKNPSGMDLEILYRKFESNFEELLKNILTKTGLEIFFNNGKFTAFNLHTSIIPALRHLLFTSYLPFSAIYIQSQKQPSEIVLQVSDIGSKVMGEAIPTIIKGHAESLVSLLAPKLAQNNPQVKSILMETISKSFDKTSPFLQKLWPAIDNWVRVMMPQIVDNAISSTTPLILHINPSQHYGSTLIDLAGRICEAVGDSMKLLLQKKQELLDLKNELQRVTLMPGAQQVISNLTQRIQTLYKTCIDPLLHVIKGTVIDNDPMSCLPVSKELKQYLWDVIIPEKLGDYLLGVHAIAIPEIQTMQKDLFTIYKSNHVFEFCRYFSRCASEVVPYKMRSSPDIMGKQIVGLLESFLSTQKTASSKLLQENLTHNKDAIHKMFQDTLDMLGGNMDRDGILKDYICPFLEEYTYPLILSLAVKFSKALYTIKENDPDYNVKLLTGLITIGAKYLKKMNEIAVNAEVPYVHDLSRNDVFKGFGKNLHPALQVSKNASPEEIRKIRMEKVFLPCTKEFLEFLNFKSSDIHAPEFLQETLFNVLGSHLGPILMELITSIFFKENEKEATIDKMEELLLNNMEAALKALDNYTSSVNKSDLPQAKPSDEQQALTDKLLIQCAEILQELVKMIPEYFMQKLLSLNAVKKMTSNQLASVLKQLCHDWPLTTIVDIIAEKTLPAICEGRWKGIGKLQKFVPESKDIRFDETDAEQKQRLAMEANRARENKSRMAKIATEGIFIGIRLFFQNLLDKIASGLLWLFTKLFGKKHGTNFHRGFVWIFHHIGALFAWVLSPIYHLISWMVYAMLMKDYSGYAHRTLKHRAHIHLVFEIMEFVINSLKKETSGLKLASP